MPNPTPEPFTAQLALTQLSESTWQTTSHPQRMGNALPIAYGGYALTAACQAAHLSAPAGYHLYSFLGNYLGPASTDRPLRATVRSVRQTRSFATRHVEVSQLQDDGKERVCLFATADFHIKEPAGSLLTYHRPPRGAYSHWSECPSRTETADALLAAGDISRETYARFESAVRVNAGLFEARMCPEGVFAQNLTGIAKAVPHSQDDRPLVERTSADWFRCASKLPSQTEQLGALAFYSDGALSFCPLSFSHLYHEDSAACSSLDFALRVFGEVDVQKWCLREITTSVGAEGRTYSEAWIWDEEGRAVACMSQQSILRAWPEKGKL
ncbi:uncharacterized protein EKO05_0005877 [Ascochyta rabiei]|uniref:Acyl-CoA hydrolase n=1 Tax=Didymella rabiei TaxID=5454 RepID=A0A163J0N2_DIDRA|nr:uncharacterized protein EKO05_0005877 [Ascochyta rabiei]KZM26066.1 acyl-CoA hydrolase [Ascochyta rabiei]UPX15430.1 hypothetical protein EKO05_0005877 [Ascochyta rabiei]